MSEHVQPVEMQMTPEQQMLQESALRYEQSLGQIGDRLPEANERKEELQSAGTELINEFGLKPELFEDPGRAIVFTAISSRWAKGKTMEGEAGYAEKVFVADSIAMLANNHSDALVDAKKVILETDTSFDTETLGRAYDKYTDTQLSQELTAAVAGGLLDGVKERLGVTNENEDPYEIRVLSIATDHDVMGLDAKNPDYSLDYKDPELAAQQLQKKQVEEWKTELKQRGLDFANEMGMEETFAAAWKTEVRGVNTLCISSALAEKILRPESTENTSYYGDRDKASDIATLEHEYTHTQGSTNIDGELSFGINLEELRAEHFSGNKLGYQDIKGFFRDFRILTGVDMASELSTLEKGGTAAQNFSKVAEVVGLDSMLEVVMAQPKNYIDKQSNIYTQETYNHIGGFDGVLGRILEAQIANGKGKEIDERITTTAAHIQSVVDGQSNYGSVAEINAMRRRYGLNVITDLIDSKAAELQKTAKAA